MSEVHGEATVPAAEQPSYGTIAPAPAPAYPVVPMQSQAPAVQAPIGKVRGTGVCILLCIVTLGIYSLFWFYAVHEEMKRHKGTGLGGGLALVLSIFVGIAMPFLTSAEAGELYERRGLRKPVSGATGLWNFPGALLVVGPLVWFIKTNGAINAYWRTLGAA